MKPKKKDVHSTTLGKYISNLPTSREASWDLKNIDHGDIFDKIIH